MTRFASTGYIYELPLKEGSDDHLAVGSRMEDNTT